ncbi:MAG: ABC transporter substrate-binding protein [Nitrospirae bacterium]|nr:ABC transporter substrate-binding protein [Nitrospirota bacterium]
MLVLSQGHAASAKTVGAIMTADIQYYRDIHKALVEEMGKDVEIVVQKPMPDPMSWTNAARKLVGIGASVIICYGAPATLTVMKETSDIPILYAGVYDPDSMNISGKNATGVSLSVPVEKVLKDLSGISKFSKLGVIFSKSEKDTIIQARDIKKSEGALGFQSVMFGIGDQVNKDDIKGVDALIMTTCGAAMSNIKDIIGAARRDKIPTAALIGGGENAGIILTVTADPKEQGAALADMLKKVLGGAKPSEIPVRQSKQLQITVNVKEAKACGLNASANTGGGGARVIE